MNIFKLFASYAKTKAAVPVDTDTVLIDLRFTLCAEKTHVMMTLGVAGGDNAFAQNALPAKDIDAMIAKLQSLRADMVQVNA